MSAANLDRADLRFLLARGYVEHRWEESGFRDGKRRFKKSTVTILLSESCFVLTDKGVRFATRLTANLHRTARSDALNESGPTSITPKPQWRRDVRQLWFAGWPVKEFRQRARNQEMILAAFEEENWPEHILDPLPPDSVVDSIDRLHDAVRKLNLKQKNRLIRFASDGQGQGVFWSAIEQFPKTS